MAQSEATISTIMRVKHSLNLAFMQFHLHQKSTSSITTHPAWAIWHQSSLFPNSHRYSSKEHFCILGNERGVGGLSFIKHWILWKSLMYNFLREVRCWRPNPVKGQEARATTDLQLFKRCKMLKPLKPLFPKRVELRPVVDG